MSSYADETGIFDYAEKGLSNFYFLNHDDAHLHDETCLMRYKSYRNELDMGGGVLRIRSPLFLVQVQSKCRIFLRLADSVESEVCLATVSW